MKKTGICFIIICLLLFFCACGEKEETSVPEKVEEEIDFQSVIDECKNELNDDFLEFAKESGYSRATIDFVKGFYVSKDGKSMMFESGVNGVMMARNSKYVEKYILTYRLKMLSVVFEKLNISSATAAKISNTRAIDGTQTDENDRIRLTWTYHPDNGLSIVFEKKG